MSEVPKYKDKLQDEPAFHFLCYLHIASHCPESVVLYWHCPLPSEEYLSAHFVLCCPSCSALRRSLLWCSCGLQTWIQRILLMCTGEGGHLYSKWLSHRLDPEPGSGFLDMLGEQGGCCHGDHLQCCPQSAWHWAKCWKLQEEWQIMLLG